MRSEASKEKPRWRLGCKGKTVNRAPLQTLLSWCPSSEGHKVRLGQPFTHIRQLWMWDFGWLIRNALSCHTSLEDES